MHHGFGPFFNTNQPRGLSRLAPALLLSVAVWVCAGCQKTHPAAAPAPTNASPWGDLSNALPIASLEALQARLAGHAGESPEALASNLQAAWNQLGTATDLEAAYWHYLHPEDVDEVRESRRQSFLVRRPYEMEYRLLRHDQMYRVVRETGRPRFDHLGIFEGYLGSVVDVSEARAAEKTLREREERLSLALFGGDLGLWDWNVVTGELHANERLALMVGRLPGELEGAMDAWRLWIHPDDLQAVDHALQEHLEGRTASYSTEHRILHKNGRWIWVLARGRVVERGRQGQALRVVGTHLDVTEQKLAREKIQRDLWSKGRDLARAEELQRTLVPRTLPLLAEAAVEGIWIPSAELSGDFFDARLSNDGRRLVVLLADCTGHGLASAMDSLLMKLLCDRHFGLAESGMLGDFLRTVNLEAFDYLSDDQYPTLFVGVLELSTGQFNFAHAASPLPLVLRADGTVEALPSVPSLPLGFDKDVVFPEAESRLEGGDQMLLFSDALVEVLQDGEIRFGLEDLMRWMAAPEAGASRSLGSLYRQAARAASREDLEDDFTAVRVRRIARRSLRRTFRDTAGLEEVLGEWASSLESCGWTTDETARLSVAVREAGMNALEHGHRGDVSKTVTLDARLDARASTVYIEDEGPGFAPELLADPADLGRLRRLMESGDPALVRGRGIFLLRRLCKSVYYHRPGNAVTLQFERQAPGVVDRKNLLQD